jgi:crotonobetainyl-CoA:carnitine CoA-transferase CaiB-like acyl-CoA transferase
VSGTTEQGRGTASVKPLAGLRVVGLTHIAAGPFALSMLADFGADVVNVEPLGGDNMRSRDGAFANLSAYFYGVNRNKRSLACDLKTPAGRKIMDQLLARADVFVHNLTVPAMERLGLDYESLRERWPRLIYCEISAWGSHGPDRDRLGMDVLAQARSGIMGITGHPGAGPAKVPVPITDLSTAMLAMSGILLALQARQRDGLGQKVETSLLQSSIALTANLIPYFHATGRPNAPLGSAHPQIAPYQAFPASDGYIVIACLTQRFWLRFCEAFGLEKLAADERFATTESRVKHRVELEAIITEAMRTRTKREVGDLLDKFGVPNGPVATLKDVLADPQVAANEMIVPLYEQADQTEVPVVGVPIKLSRTPGSLDRGAAALGEDTSAVLSDLGYSDSEIAALIADQTIAQPGGAGR